jgi:hypothetical protein
MTVLHQKARAMLLRLDGKRLGDLNRFDTGHVQFVSTWRTIVASEVPDKDE